MLSTVQNEFLAGQDDVLPVLRGFLLSPSPSLLLLNLKSPFSLQRSFGGKSFRARIFSNLLVHSSTLITQVENKVKTLVLIPLLFIFQRIEHLKSNRGRKAHLCGKWKDFFMISHRCSLSHRENLTAVLSVKVRFLNCRAKKIKVITLCCCCCCCC